jgi:hypothetical protein
MAKGTFERKKPHVNVGTIGHVDHGKTTAYDLRSSRSKPAKVSPRSFGEYAFSYVLLCSANHRRRELRSG